MTTEQFPVPEPRYEFTRDPQLLAAYAQLVLRYYKKDLQLDLEAQGQAAALTQVAENEQVLVVRLGERVVAGARLSCVPAGSGQGLPLEAAGYQVTGLLPVTHPALGYAEIGRLVVDPDYRGKAVLAQMITELTQRALGLGCGYLFVMAPALNALLYRRVCKSLQMPMVVHTEVAPPEEEAYRHFDLKLLSCDIRGLATAVGLRQAG